MTMNLESATFMKHVLAAIKVVKRQRQRPGIERVCRALRLQQRVKIIDEFAVERLLEAAVKRGDLFAVDKHNYRSYQATEPRGPGKQPESFRQSLGGADTVFITNTMRKVLQAVVDIVKCRGTPTLQAICDHIRRHSTLPNSNPSALLQRIRVATLRAVKAELLAKDGKVFSLTANGRTLLATPKDRSNNVIVAGQPKLLLDSVLARKEPAECIPICSLCLGTNKKNRDDVAETMLCCVDCGRCGHPSCLKFSARLTANAKRMRWQCIECKMCSVCAEAGREVNMLFCDECDRGFHMDCCQPPILRRPKGNWICFICDQRQRKVFVNGCAVVSRSLNKTCAADDDTVDVDGASEWDDWCKPDMLPPGVDQCDSELFSLAQQRINEKLGLIETSATASVSERPTRCPPAIEIGKYHITTWYSAPYPPNFARLPVLCICEFCLSYMDSRTVLDRHLTRCPLSQPPGNEVYRQDNLSIFEVDGKVSPIYCQNLCLLAKLFLDHKTLYYDVEPFVFYVLTINDVAGCHVVGYFSKEKYSQHKYNLSCIMTLPQYQRRGYGRLLIDFSYMLSRVEGVPGSPEKPLSDLGQISYDAYWKDAILDQLESRRDDQKVTLQGLSEATGITIADIVSTLQSLNFLAHVDDDRCVLAVDADLLARHRAKHESRATSHVTLDVALLRWSPHVSTSFIDIDDKRSDSEEHELSLVDSDVMTPVKPVEEVISLETAGKRLRRSPGAALRSPSSSTAATPCSKSGRRRRQPALDDEDPSNDAVAEMGDVSVGKNHLKKLKFDDCTEFPSSFPIPPLKSSTPLRHSRGCAGSDVRSSAPCGRGGAKRPPAAARTDSNTTRHSATVLPTAANTSTHPHVTRSSGRLSIDAANIPLPTRTRRSFGASPQHEATKPVASGNRETADGCGRATRATRSLSATLAETKPARPSRVTRHSLNADTSDDILSASLPTPQQQQQQQQCDTKDTLTSAVSPNTVKRGRGWPKGVPRHKKMVPPANIKTEPEQKPVNDITAPVLLPPAEPDTVPDLSCVSIESRPTSPLPTETDSITLLGNSDKLESDSLKIPDKLDDRALSVVANNATDYFNDDNSVENVNKNLMPSQDGNSDVSNEETVKQTTDADFYSVFQRFVSGIST